MNQGDMDRDEFVRKLEDIIKKAAHQMDEALQRNDIAQFSKAAEAWGQASGVWLQAAQGMSWEKAEAVMIGFATGGELDKWVHERRPGPAPTVLSLYPPYKPNRPERDNER